MKNQMVYMVIEEMDNPPYDRRAVEIYANESDAQDDAHKRNRASHAHNYFVQAWTVK